MCNIDFFEGLIDGTFKDKQQLTYEDGSPFIIPNVSFNAERVFGALALIDWNSDSLFDVLFMSNHMPLTLYLNSGSKTKPRFMDSVTVEIGGEEVRREFPSLDVADINLDGLPDIIIGSKYLVECAFNSGSKMEAQYDSVTLLKRENGEIFEYSKTEYMPNPFHKEAKVAVGDLNGDGFPDLLLGENTKSSSMIPVDYLYLFYGIPDGTQIENNKSIDIDEKHFDVKGSKVDGFSVVNGSERRVTLSILDLQGRHISSLNSSEGEIKLPLRSLGDGVYILEINAEGVKEIHCIHNM